MGRRARNKQGAPPSLEEFEQGRKRKAEKQEKKVKKAKKVEPVEPVEEELPEVDLEEEKKTLFEDSDDEEGGDSFDEEDLEEQAAPMWSDDDSDASESQLTSLNASNMEAFSRQLDEEEAEEAEEAEAELTSAPQPTAVVLPETLEEAPAGAPQDVTALRTRMLEITKVLEKFKELAEPGRSRADYTAQLLADILAYYGYLPFLADKLFHLFLPAEAMEFFEANEVHRPITIRTNTLVTRRRDLAQTLVNRGVNLQPIGNWTKVGLQVFELPVPIGATPEYLAGHYILQAALSFLPVMALAPVEHERVLDMAAAPGGKTTYILALMKNTGCVFANDANKARTKSLIANIHRLGCTNTVVCNYDAREFPKVMGGFDRVLLDAPCSGTGVIAKDESVKTLRTEKDFIQIPHLQKQLLLLAIDSVDANSKTGGVIVYSTCSVAVEENEAVVAYALRKRPNVKLVETELGIGKPGFVSFRGKHFGDKMSLTRRYYPHTYNVDGFFVAKFVKTAPSVHDTSKAGAYEKEAEARADEKLIQDDFAVFEGDEELVEATVKRNLKRRGIDTRKAGEKSGEKSGEKADAKE